MLNLSQIANKFCSIKITHKDDQYLFLEAGGAIRNTLNNELINEYKWKILNDRLVVVQEGNHIHQFVIDEIEDEYILFRDENQSSTTLFCVENKLDLAIEVKTIFANRNDIKKNYLEVGKQTLGEVELIAKEYGKVTIGNYCSIAPGVTIIAGNHRVDLVSTYSFASILQFLSDENAPSIKDHDSKGSVSIGNDVWIGHSAQIMSGVKIGDGAIIASNSVVTRNIEPYTIVGGNPAKFLKYRVEDESLRNALCNIAWWNWDESKIKENLDKIISPDLNAFVQEFS